MRSSSTFLIGILVVPLLAACGGDGGRTIEPPSASPLQLTRAIGGQVGDLVVSAPYAYVATGRVVATWTYSDPNAPEQVSVVEEPAGGVLKSLVRLGDYLYACWQTGNDGGGVAVYSLADPARPELVNEIPVDADISHVGAIAAANDHLYVFDSENGVLVGSVDDPASPVFTMAGVGTGVQYARAFTEGNRIHTFGKNFFGDSLLTSFDVSTPEAPQAAPSFSADGIDVFDLRYDAPFAIGFGLKLSVLDLSDPNQPVARGSADALAFTGIANGDHAYGVGFDGLDVWDIGNPDNPVAVKHLDIDTLATFATANVQGGSLMLTATDRFVFLDTSDPTTPSEQGSALLRGSVDAYDAALVGNTVLFLQQNYGLAVADAATLDVVGRHEFALPAAVQDRVFSDMHVEGNLAYLAAWGFGLLIADMSNPRAPVELARLPAPFSHTVAVAAGHAYLGKNTNGPEIAIADVADPAHPSLLVSYSVPYTPAQLEVLDGRLYVAGYPDQGAGSVGLRIIDVSDPLNAAELGFYDEGCPEAYEVALADAAQLAYLACGNGLHIVDVSDPAQPVRVGYAPVQESHDVRTSLAVRGERAWYGSPAGVFEFDIADPKAPRQVQATDTGTYGPINMRAISDDRMLVMTGIAGIHVFERAQ